MSADGFVGCDRACKGCTNVGAQNCLECATKHFNDSGTCKGEWKLPSLHRKTVLLCDVMDVLILYLCLACHKSCGEGGCTGAGPENCVGCRKGFEDSEEGCIGKILI